MERSTLMTSRSKTRLISLDDLRKIKTPAKTETHHPIPHHEVVDALVAKLGSEGMFVSRTELAVSQNGQRCFGLIEIDRGLDGLHFAMGLRNSHDMSMCLGLTVGYRVFVCDNMGFYGDFMPILRKHTSGIDLQRTISMGVDVIQRSLDPMVKSITLQRAMPLSDMEAKLVIYRAFIEGELDVPRHLGKDVHGNYFKPIYNDFAPRTVWSLVNAMTGALQKLDAVQQYRATGKLGEFVEKLMRAWTHS